MRLSRLWRKEHRVAVYDVRPRPGKDDDFEPYFVAICECGWLGDIRENSDDALADAREHTPNVQETIERPVG